MPAEREQPVEQVQPAEREQLAEQVQTAVQEPERELFAAVQRAAAWVAA